MQISDSPPKRVELNDIGKDLIKELQYISSELFKHDSNVVLASKSKIDKADNDLERVRIESSKAKTYLDKLKRDDLVPNQRLAGRIWSIKYWSMNNAGNKK